MGVEPPLAFAVGVAKNVGVVHALEEVLGETLIVPDEPQIVGALGAALVVWARVLCFFLPNWFIALPQQALEREVCSFQSTCAPGQSGSGSVFRDYYAPPVPHGGTTG